MTAPSLNKELLRDYAFWLGGEESPEEISATLHCNLRG